MTSNKLADGLAPISAQADLYVTAATALRGNNVDVKKALPAFVDQLKSSAALLMANSSCRGSPSHDR
jgi:hypothetical protein